ncbi:putative ABC transport system ATP-binding protein [Halohasta litchfieldiae]|uniref:Putative ABC transport system ATP-binding protein n=1 Tax=Halohasta litchfieldiae TaxID=1073996 RepID=A0A1H6XGH9_9EURY|nr:putative ABC transport system ATP-binding protein [Halohasta litchfieldiae]SEJ27246.1 putative ABC transport system ATP-binding protein [Halohasta litchfieldiae]
MTRLPLIDCVNLSRSYGRGGSRSRWFRRGNTETPTVTALSNIDLQIERGEIVGCAGPSGSGKSTLLHLLAGLDMPTTGTVSFDGTDLSSLSDRARTRHRLDHVGIVFQHFHLLESLSARANVALPLVELGRPKSERRERATELLEAMGLGDRVTHRPTQLSGGEQQRVAIARALVTEPDLVIADEPTGELDTQTGKRVLSRFREVATELDAAVVIASHDEPTLAIADRLVRMRDGRIEDIEILSEDDGPQDDRPAKKSAQLNQGR